MSLTRCGVSLVVAATVCGVLTILLFAASAYVLPHVGPGVEAQVGFSTGVVATWVVLGLVAILVWTAGLFLIGGLAWLVLHRLGLVRRFHALIAGALLAGVAGYVFGVLAHAPFPTAWFIAFALIGMVGAWIVWARGYGPTGRTLAPPE